MYPIAKSSDPSSFLGESRCQRVPLRGLVPLRPKGSFGRVFTNQSHHENDPKSSVQHQEAMSEMLRSGSDGRLRYSALSFCLFVCFSAHTASPLLPRASLRVIPLVPSLNGIAAESRLSRKLHFWNDHPSRRQRIRSQVQTQTTDEFVSLLKRQPCLRLASIRKRSALISTKRFIFPK
jgi:hypothetical protein